MGCGGTAKSALGQGGSSAAMSVADMGTTSGTVLIGSLSGRASGSGSASPSGSASDSETGRLSSSLVGRRAWHSGHDKCPGWMTASQLGHLRSSFIVRIHRHRPMAAIHLSHVERLRGPKGTVNQSWRDGSCVDRRWCIASWAGATLWRGVSPVMLGVVGCGYDRPISTMRTSQLVLGSRSPATLRARRTGSSLRVRLDHILSRLEITQSCSR